VSRLDPSGAIQFDAEHPAHIGRSRVRIPRRTPSILGHSLWICLSCCSRSTITASGRGRVPATTRVGGSGAAARPAWASPGCASLVKTCPGSRPYQGHLPGRAVPAPDDTPRQKNAVVAVGHTILVNVYCLLVREGDHQDLGAPTSMSETVPPCRDAWSDAWRHSATPSGLRRPAPAHRLTDAPGGGREVLSNQVRAHDGALD
jgi:hypothetical protein